eukprot:scaffold11839_cov124-Isochrysis_galbana.AAC.6
MLILAAVVLVAATPIGRRSARSPVACPITRRCRGAVRRLGCPVPTTPTTVAGQRRAIATTRRGRSIRFRRGVARCTAVAAAACIRGRGRRLIRGRRRPILRSGRAVGGRRGPAAPRALVPAPVPTRAIPAIGPAAAVAAAGARPIPAAILGRRGGHRRPVPHPLQRAARRPSARRVGRTRVGGRVGGDLERVGPLRGRGKPSLKLAALLVAVVGQLGRADLDVLLPVIVRTRPRPVTSPTSRAERRLGDLAGQEEGVAERPRGGGSLGRIPPHHLGHQVQRLGRGGRDERAERRGHKLWELEVHILGQRQALLPGVGGGRAEHGADLVDLVRLGGAGEEWPQGEHLAHDGADGPDVNRCSVRRRPQQHLGRAVPPGRDVVGVGRLGSDLASQPKVGHLERVSGDEHVLRLNVPVEEAVLVHVRERLQHLVRHVAHLGLGEELIAVLAELVQVHLEELKHKV